MDSRHSSSSIGSSRARPVARLTNGDQLADRARALVDRTRAGLGTRDLSVKTRDGLGVRGLDKYPDILPDYDLGFVDDLTSIRAEHVQACKDMTKQSRQRELTVIVNGVSQLLDNVGMMNPKMASRVSKCQELLNKILSGASFGSDGDFYPDDSDGWDYGSGPAPDDGDNDPNLPQEKGNGKGQKGSMINRSRRGREPTASRPSKREPTPDMYKSRGADDGSISV